MLTPRDLRTTTIGRSLVFFRDTRPKRDIPLRSFPVLAAQKAKYAQHLPEDLLKRLIQENISQRFALKLGRKCVTPAVALDIRKRWNKQEVVKIDASTPKARANMKVTRAALEEATGGTVIWNEGAKVLLYNSSDNAERKERETAENAVNSLDDSIVQAVEQ